MALVLLAPLEILLLEPLEAYCTVHETVKSRPPLPVELLKSITRFEQELIVLGALIATTGAMGTLGASNVAFCAVLDTNLAQSAELDVDGHCAFNTDALSVMTVTPMSRTTFELVVIEMLWALVQLQLRLLKSWNPGKWNEKMRLHKTVVEVMPP